jgi:TatD DNase family protein
VGEGRVTGVFHCFTGDVPMARRALDLGFSVSFAGIITFPKGENVREAAAIVPDDRLLVETDSPYLAPVPMRGKKCEPSYVVHTAARLAELRGRALADIEAQTTENAARVFGVSIAENLTPA